VLQQIWAKFNANERLVAIGSGVVLLGWLIGVISPGGLGIGVAILGVLGAVAALVILYLKYAPNTNVTWPAPIPVLLFGIGIVAIGVGAILLLQLLPYLGFISQYLGSWILPFVVYLVGAALMAWGGYKEWAATRTTTA
jgi:hypothetical protein